MSLASQFFGGSLPVGSIVQAPYNLTDAAYLPCLGQKLVRASYPALSACLPSVGTFTPTTRNLNTAKAAFGLCATATKFVMSGDSAGTPSIQTSTDAVTWTPSVTPSAAIVTALLNEGTNVIAACNTGGSPWYSTNGGATFNPSSGGTPGSSAALNDTLAFAPRLGTVGRIGYISGNGSNFYYSDDRGLNYTTVALPGTAHHLCDTGSKWLAIGSGGFFASPTGLSGTWTTLPWPADLGAINASAGGMASDGAGKVIISSYSAGYAHVVISLDHGANFVLRQFGGPRGGVLNLNGAPSYSNGRFFLPASGGGTQGVIVSADLQAWVQVIQSGMIASTAPNGSVAYKNGVYVEASGTAATCTSWVEDTTKMYLPSPSQASGDQTISTKWNNFMPWIKAK